MNTNEQRTDSFGKPLNESRTAKSGKINETATQKGGSKTDGQRQPSY